MYFLFFLCEHAILNTSWLRVRYAAKRRRRRVVGSLHTNYVFFRSKSVRKTYGSLRARSSILFFVSNPGGDRLVWFSIVLCNGKTFASKLHNSNAVIRNVTWKSYWFPSLRSVFFNFFAVITVRYFLLLEFFFRWFFYYRFRTGIHPPVAGSAPRVCRRIDFLSPTRRQRLSDVSSKFLPSVKRRNFFF